MKRLLLYTQSFALGVMLIATVAIGIFPDKVREGFRNAINADIAKEFERPIKLAEKTLEIPGMGILLSPDKLKIVREEIILYRSDPVEYIKSLTGNVDSSKDRLQEAITGAGPSQRVILEKIIGWREKIKNHFSVAFDMVVIYLIIFLIANIVSLLFAIYLMRWAPSKIPHLVSTSLILTLIVGFSSFLFLDRDWTYVFIKNEFYLSSYPIGLLIAFIYVLFQYHKYRILIKS
jgi:hypothetical protein